MRKNVKILLSLIMAATMPAGCDEQSSEKLAENGASGQITQASAGKEGGADSEDRKVITYATQKEPKTLDPTTDDYVISSIVLQDLLTGLMQIGPDGGLTNGCTEKCEVNGDGPKHTLILRGGLKRPSSSPLTADDSGYAWRRALAQDTVSSGAWHLSYLKNDETHNEGRVPVEDVSIKVKDDETLKVTLEDPTIYFIDLATVTAYFPAKKDIVEGPEAWAKSADVYIDSGAFRLKEINPQASYVLGKSPEHIGANTAKLDGMNIVFIESAEAALSAYNVEEADVVDNTVIQTQAQSQHGGSDELRPYDSIGTCYYGFNCEKDYLLGTRVRKALTMSLNRDVINQSIVASRSEPPYALVPHSVPYEGFSGDYRIMMGNLFTEDVEVTKALMEEIGYPSGKKYPILVLITQDDQEKKDVTQVVQVMWKKNLGVNVEVITLEPKVYWDRQTADNLNICYDGWTGDYSDPSTDLDCFLLQRDEAQCRRFNDQTKEYDSMMRGARSLTDDKEHMELFEVGGKFPTEETPILPPYYRNAQPLVKSGCEGAIKTYIGHTISKYADKQ